MAWREDRRRDANGTQCVAIAGFALRHRAHSEMRGYWQRSFR
jgi:hypothetical protein